MVILFLLKQKHWYHFPKQISVLITLDQDKTLDQKAPEDKEDKHDLPPAKLSPRQSKFGVMWASESEIPPLEIPKPQDLQSDFAKASPDKPNFAHPEEPGETLVQAWASRRIEL